MVEKREWYDLTEQDRAELKDRIVELTISIDRKKSTIKNMEAEKKLVAEELKAESAERSDLAYALDNSNKPDNYDGAVEL